MKVEGGNDVSISLYPPSSNSPALFTNLSSSNWSGTTTDRGNHELVVISKSGQPVDYQITLSAESMTPKDPVKPSTPVSPPEPSKTPELPTPTPSNKSTDPKESPSKTPLF